MPPTANKSEYSSLVSTISLQSSSDLDTNQGEIIDEMLKQVAWTVNQMLLKTTTGSPTSNLDLSDTAHDNTSYRQSAPTLNTSDVHKHTTISLKNTYRSDLSEHMLTHSITNLDRKQNKSL